MLQALIASAGRAAAGAVAEGAVAEGVATAAKASPVDTAKKLLENGSNHSNAGDGSSWGDMAADADSALSKAVSSTGPGTDLSGGNSLYRSL